MKKLFLVLVIAMMAIPSFAQNGSPRCQGFFIRPSLYGGVFVDAGYQFNPYIQASAGGGVSLVMANGSLVNSYPAYIAHGGVRAYTSRNKWAGMFDYHAGYHNFRGRDYIRQSLVGGASFDNLDFGGGLFLIHNTSGDYAYGLLVTVGWNFRFCR